MLLSGVSRIASEFSGWCDRMLAMDVYASQLYDGVLAMKRGEKNPDLCEFHKKLIKI